MATIAAPPKIRFRDAQMEMAHGAGGKASRRLVEGLFAPLLVRLGRGAAGRRRASRVSTERASAITTDSFVVRPLRFPGGSIGELAVNGTVNDLAVSGARAEALVVSLCSRSRPAHAGSGSRSARHGRRRAQAPASSSPAATPKWSSTARPTACTSPPPASAARFPDVELSPRSVAARRSGDSLRAHRRSRHHHSAGARRSGSGSRSSLRHPAGAAARGSAGGRRCARRCAGCAIPRAAAWPPR